MFVVVALIASSFASEPATAPVAPVEAAAPAEAAAPVEAAAPSGPVTYKLDAKKSTLAVITRIDKSTMLSSMGHDHSIVASTFDGTVTWDMADLSTCSVKISFPVTALVVDPGDARTRFKLEGETTAESDKAKIKANFEGKSQIDSSRFPQISFESTSCAAKGDKVAVTGALSIHGTAKPVTALMSVSADGKGFAGKGSFEASHSDFGFSPFSAAFGALKNSESLSFFIDVKGAAQ